MGAVDKLRDSSTAGIAVRGRGKGRASDRLCKSEQRTQLGPQVLPYFENAQQELLVMSPYFWPG